MKSCLKIYQKMNLPTPLVSLSRILLSLNVSSPNFSLLIILVDGSTYYGALSPSIFKMKLYPPCPGRDTFLDISSQSITFMISFSLSPLTSVVLPQAIPPVSPIMVMPYSHLLIRYIVTSGTPVDNNGLTCLKAILPKIY